MPPPQWQIAIGGYIAWFPLRPPFEKCACCIQLMSGWEKDTYLGGSESC